LGKQTGVKRVTVYYLDGTSVVLNNIENNTVVRPREVQSN